ncbi:MAG: DUF3658 domain-containing protein [Pseudolabrys sp.]|nr:DUF3658 domain-containing protein [Pseudolabrys sp.]
MPDDPEEPHVSSTLKWQDVSLPQAVTESDLDAVILSVLQNDWCKTAMIISRTRNDYEARAIFLDLEIIGARIQVLADAVRIESQGNVSRWRHSEVRLRQD